jgi:hypothetical protein
VTDTKYNDTRVKAAKAVRTFINNTPGDVKISSIRLFILENYGIGGRWVENYLRDLGDSEEITLQLLDNKIVGVKK